MNQQFTNALLHLNGPIEFECEYRNWRGETATRRLRVISVWHGMTEWHPAPGLMLKARDLDRDVVRAFAMKDFNLETLKALPRAPDLHQPLPVTKLVRDDRDSDILTLEFKLAEYKIRVERLEKAREEDAEKVREAEHLLAWMAQLVDHASEKPSITELKLRK